MICAAAFGQQPRIDSVSPSQGPISGGTIISLTGANLAGATVALDRVAIVPLSQTDSEIRLQMPKHDNGYVVISAAIGVAVAYGRFLYVPPALSELPPGYITTVAGAGAYKGEFGPATEAMMNPFNLAVDTSGNIYVGEENSDSVSRIRTDGILERYAGRGPSQGETCCGDGGPAADAYVGFPRGIALDRNGNLFIADHTYRIRRVDAATGVITTIAGNGQFGDSGDGGPATNARIGLPVSIAIDATGNVYFTDLQANRVRRIDPNGIITSFAGNGTRGFSGDGGPANAASYSIHDSDTGALAVDAAGSVYIGDYDNNRIRKIDPGSGIITTFGQWTNSGSDPANPLGVNCIAADASGNIYYGGKTRLVEISPAGALVRSWGAGIAGFSPDGTTLAQLRFNALDGLAFEANGDLLISESGLNRVRRLNFAANKIETVAGVAPGALGEGGMAIAATFHTPNIDIDVSPSGELLIGDFDRIYKVEGSGKIVRIAGGGLPTAFADVPALSASTNNNSISTAVDGTIDYTGGNVFRIDPDGFVRLTAGRFGNCTFEGDGGDASSAVFCQAWDALRDAAGNVYIADTDNNRIRRVDARTHIIDTIAGSGPTNGQEGYGRGTTCGDGGPATSACINTPYGLTFDDEGNLFVCENEERIRKIDPKGVISTLAQVHCTKITWAFGNLYTVAADHVARISASGEVTKVTPPRFGFAGDGGPATEARIFGQKQSHGVAVDRDGNLYFADGDNLRIRAIRYGAVLAPTNATITAGRDGERIRAIVSDGNGAPARSVRVDFTAPSSGPTCALSSSFAITDANGIATVTCTPNCVAGTYTVTAQPMAAPSTATIPFANATIPCRRRAVSH